MSAREKGNTEAWDEDEDVGTRGPEPDRLKSEMTPEELAKQIMRAGHPKKVTQRRPAKKRDEG